MRVLVALVFCLILVPAARAQDAVPYLPKKDTYQVLVIGDSLAAGLWSGMMRMAADDAALAVDGRYKEDSGLARPEYYDWNEALPKILDSNPTDIAVILLGANDRQVIRDGVLRHGFETDAWLRVYAGFADKLIAGIKQRGAAVYWVGLPPMQAKDYDSAVQKIAALQRERAGESGVRFVETRAAFAANDTYTDQGPDESGVMTRLRSRDGVHFLRPGNNRLANLVLDAIRADIKKARETPPPPPPPDTAGKEDQAAAPGLAFGAESNVIHLDAGQAGNTVIMNQPAGAAGTKAPSGAPIADPKEAAKPGTSAARLFTLGESVPSKPGRFDDFSLPQ